MIAGIGAARPDAVEQGAVLEKYGGIIAAHGGAQQPDGILGVRGESHLPAHPVDPHHLVGFAVPGIATLRGITAGHPHYQRSGKAVVGAPADGAAVVELLGGRVGILAELDLRHRHQPGDGHAHRPADDSFLR